MRGENRTSYLYYREQHDAANAPRVPATRKVLCDVGDYREALVLSSTLVKPSPTTSSPQVGWRCARPSAVRLHPATRTGPSSRVHGFRHPPRRRALTSRCSSPSTGLSGGTLTEAIGLYRRKGNVVGARRFVDAGIA
jgi:hypothetical protein